MANQKKEEEKKLVAFRCPTDLLKQIDRKAKEYHLSRKDFLIMALRLFAALVKKRGGHITSPSGTRIAGEEIAFFKACLEQQKQQPNPPQD